MPEAMQGKLHCNIELMQALNCCPLDSKPVISGAKVSLLNGCELMEGFFITANWFKGRPDMGHKFF